MGKRKKDTRCLQILDLVIFWILGTGSKFIFFRYAYSSIIGFFSLSLLSRSRSLLLRMCVMKSSFVDYRILAEMCVIIETREPPKCNFICSSFYFIIWGFAATSPSKLLHKFDILFRISRISGVLILPAKLIARRIMRIFAIFAVP